MAKKKRSKFFETRFFGLVIGVLIILLFILINETTNIISRLEIKMLDTHFDFKDVYLQEDIQVGATQREQNPNINEDILIVGIDFESLTTYGKWPFPRYREADLVSAFSRIDYQNDRERALFLDIFFIEPDKNATDDIKLISSIEENGRVFLETVLDELPSDDDVIDEFFARQQKLYDGWGEITNIKGDWQGMTAFYGLQPPLQPYAEKAKGYGHANFDKDYDKVYRRQALVSKSSELVSKLKFIYPFPEKTVPDYSGYLTPDTVINEKDFERLVWFDKNGRDSTVEYPLDIRDFSRLASTLESKSAQEKIYDSEGNLVESYFVVYIYKDHFLPSITLSLALTYFNKTLDDVQIELGKYLTIPSPQRSELKKVLDERTGLMLEPRDPKYKVYEWVPYYIVTKKAVFSTEEDVEKGRAESVNMVLEEEERRIFDEIKIPIDEEGRMIINFMGPPSYAESDAYQTFPVRSFSSYASKNPGSDPVNWRTNMGVGNQILMVGPFARGMAADQKTTPYGLMYGVEIHANSLNTILMDKFIKNVPLWIDILVLVVLVMLIAFITSRLSTILAFIVTLVSILLLFVCVSFIFDRNAVMVNFSSPTLGMIFAFLSIVVYRVMTEERDKRRIKNMFGTYVSPKVVDQILDNPPELGGVDKHLTVYFSDIRGFTTMSESMTPQDLVNHLNVYLTAMTDIILEYNGTLDKYEGDAIMCFWGAPVPQEDHAIRACRAALKQMKALEKLNESWPAERRINIGIGLNSGIMTVGNMGSMQRMDYTIMGDPVNLGARLEGTNKAYGTNIIISEYTYGLVKDHVIVRELDNLRVKGKNKPVLIYELIDCIDGLEMPDETEGKSKKRKE